MSLHPGNVGGRVAVEAQDNVSNGLNLTLELKCPMAMPALLAGLKLHMTKVQQALGELHFVHFARFLPTRGNKALLVITEFDGPLQPYVMDFAVAIGDVFSFILGFVKDAPPLPVQNHPRAFWTFIERNNRVVVLPGLAEWDNFPIYSAYPKRTVIDIVGARRIGLPPPVEEPKPVPITFSDVQGNVLSGYRSELAVHLSVQIESAAAARRLILTLLDGDGEDCPTLSHGERWEKGAPPPYLLNLGITAAGLRALGVPADELGAMPAAFLEGPGEPERARANGDVDGSAPERWEVGRPGQPVHLLLSLFGRSDNRGEFERRLAQLSVFWERPGLALVSDPFRAEALPDGRVHFGYRDGLTNPRIVGVPDNGKADMQPRCAVGEVLLGTNYPSVYGGPSLDGMPARLCQNGTFAVVRIIEQDAAGFERLLKDESTRLGMDPELIAAKMMGRWRDGRPLNRPGPGGENDFDYAPTHANPETFDDHEGVRCPIGSHVRRMNPRSAVVAGRPHSRRIIRRGMAYGPAWQDGEAPGVRRGLFGLFICADISRQFDFLMQAWANGDIAASNVRGTQDPFIGAQNLSGQFRFPGEAGNTVAMAVPRLVTTRGSLYLLMPGHRGLRYLASLEGGF
ncbi:hypothetical protein [Rhizobacter sp. Root1221]|uniref:Dyp-type peroxidase n=1 Tax=Rhizobacter sp. Root1221 TaxID=1736433 RepID=UPI0006F68A70|nr:hypothetical protein [Rhizobacter sp. Root1221]KQV83036.1 hypothetical protein ASC87_08835 [Rhizobacter sp. Root1221]